MFDNNIGPLSSMYHHFPDHHHQQEKRISNPVCPKNVFKFLKISKCPAGKQGCHTEGNFTFTIHQGCGGNIQVNEEAMLRCAGCQEGQSGSPPTNWTVKCLEGLHIMAELPRGKIGTNQTAAKICFSFVQSAKSFGLLNQDQLEWVDSLNQSIVSMAGEGISLDTSINRGNKKTLSSTFDDCFNNLMAECEHLMKLLGVEVADLFVDHLKKPTFSVVDCCLNVQSFLLAIAAIHETRIQTGDNASNAWKPQPTMLLDWKFLIDQIEQSTKDEKAGTRVLYFVLDCLSKRTFKPLPQEISDLIMTEETRDTMMIEMFMRTPQTALRMNESLHSKVGQKMKKEITGFGFGF